MPRILILLLLTASAFAQAHKPHRHKPAATVAKEVKEDALCFGRIYGNGYWAGCHPSVIDDIIGSYHWERPLSTMRITFMNAGREQWVGYDESGRLQFSPGFTAEQALELLVKYLPGMCR